MMAFIVFKVNNTDDKYMYRSVTATHFIFYSPLHWLPLLVYPSLHVHTNDPLVLRQLALSPHMFGVKHSSLSLKHWSPSQPDVQSKIKKMKDRY